MMATIASRRSTEALAAASSSRRAAEGEIPHREAYDSEMTEFTVNLANRPGMLAALIFTDRAILTPTLPPRPNSLAEMARSLADSGINIDAMYLLNSCAAGLEFAVVVEEPARGRAYLH